MKIGFIMPMATVSYSGGIAVQGRMWKKGLENLGHECFLINQWDKFDYNNMDYIIFIGKGRILLDYARTFKKFFNHPKLVCAPIIDERGSLLKFHIRAKYYGSVKYHMRKDLHDLYYAQKYFDFYLARSEYEKKFIEKGLDVPESKIYIVPISMRMSNVPELDMGIKEDYCLHMSRLADPGKNVSRLILAAKKYKFNLKLGGTLNDNEKEWLDKQIGNSEDIEYLGWLTEDELLDVYRKAKVFALPSFVEGVGMVALEAAVNGAEIVLTNIGAPKEYYDGRAVLVNPYSVDSIGEGVVEAMTTKKAQPELREHILNNYTLDINCKQMQDILIENL